MLSIDEAIEQEIFKARVDKIKANKRIFHNNDEDEISACHRSAEEHEQLAEWLEELKEIKSNGRYVQGNKAGQKIGYRNAIDDLSNKICMHFADWKYSEDDKCIKDIIELASESVEEIAEQLKEGGENEQ